MIRELVNEDTGKSFIISLKGKTVCTKSGNRENDILYDSESKALETFHKKKWEKLKKGFIFKTEELQKGKARFHKFISKEYTGCLSIVNIEGNVGVYKHNDFKKEHLQIFSSNGTFIETIELNKGIPWNLSFSKPFNSLFITADHCVIKLDLSTRKFEHFTDSFDKPSSFISLGSEHLFYGSDPMIYLRDLQTNEIIFSKKAESQLYSGHSSQLIGAITEDGNKIALCRKAGEIEISNCKGALIKLIQDDFEMVAQIEFLNDATLLIREKYGSWGLRIFDVESGKELANPFNSHSFHGTLVDCFDINHKEDKIIVVCRNNATLYDIKSFEQILEFEIEHCSKRSDAIFLGNSTIATRTDYGCFSLYHI